MSELVIFSPVQTQTPGVMPVRDEVLMHYYSKLKKYFINYVILDVCFLLLFCILFLNFLYLILVSLFSYLNSLLCISINCHLVIING
jgi:hypothetical protein